MARPRTSLSCGRKCSLCGSRFIISSTALRVLCSGPSSKCGACLQHLLERGKERGEERGVLGGVHDLDALANRRDQREAILGLVILDQLFRVRLELAAREGRRVGTERGGPGVRFRRVGRENLAVAPASAHHRTGGPRRVCARVDLPRMIDAAVLESRADPRARTWRSAASSARRSRGPTSCPSTAGKFPRGRRAEPPPPTSPSVARPLPRSPGDPQTSCAHVEGAPALRSRRAA